MATSNNDTTIWREAVENAYQNFLNYGMKPDWRGWELWPVMFYDCVESDGWIEKDFWRSMMVRAKSSFIEELQRKMAVTAMRTSMDELWRKGRLQSLEAEIQEYRNNQKEDNVMRRAKQFSVVKVFRQGKKIRKEKLYEKVT